MVEIFKSSVFDVWLSHLKDRQVKARVETRIRQLSLGNPGQHRNLTHGISEMKIDLGPGYRVYYTMRGKLLVILLCGGNKKTQQKDIATAIRLAETWEE